VHYAALLKPRYDVTTSVYDYNDWFNEERIAFVSTPRLLLQNERGWNPCIH
jgi:hypothetical protein|tara:strand:- start:166 stop:318 length:153 start_codon:yes stop_codon:yes gene_type:complete